MGNVVQNIEINNEPRPTVNVVFLSGGDLVSVLILLDIAQLAERYAAAFVRFSNLNIKALFMKNWLKPGARYGGVA